MALSLTDFMALEPKPVPFLIGRGVLPANGKMIIGAPSKSNKSFVAINILLALARGTPLFNAHYKNGTPVMPVIRPCKVLYMEQELGPDRLQGRLRSILAAVGTSAADVQFFVKTRDTAMRLDVPEGADMIKAEVAEVKPDVVCFDPMAKFHLGDENSSMEMGYVQRILDHIIEDNDCATIVVHHTKLPHPDNPLRGGMKLRGSSAIFADIDTYVDLERLSNEQVKEPILRMSFELRSDEPLEQMHFKRMKSGEVIWMGEDFLWGGGEHRDLPRGRGKYQRA